MVPVSCVMHKYAITIPFKKKGAKINKHYKNTAAEDPEMTLTYCLFVTDELPFCFGILFKKNFITRIRG